MMDATVTNGQLATHLSDLLTAEKGSDDLVETNKSVTKTDTDLDALFNEVTRLEERAKEKNATALQLPKSETSENTVTTSDKTPSINEPLNSFDVESVGRDVFAGTHSINTVSDDSEVKSEPVGRDVFTGTRSVNIVSGDSEAKSEPVGRDVFAGTHSIGRRSESTTVLPTQTTTQTISSKQEDKNLIKVFAVNNKVYWYSRDNLDDRSNREIYELSEQEALDYGMHHSKTEGAVKKTYFTAEELAERNKKDGTVFGTDNTAAENSGTSLQLPHTGDVPVPVPLASALMGLGTFLLAWLKKRKKKRQKRFAD